MIGSADIRLKFNIHNKNKEIFESYVFRSDILSRLPENKFEQKNKAVYQNIERINEISSYQFKIDSALNKFDKPR